MVHLIGLAAILLLPVGVSQTAPASTAASAPVTIEHYYRIRWGQADEFKRLYRRNHEPLLAALREQGFVIAMRTDVPFTHMAGEERWDMRVTVTYRDAGAALGGGPADAAFEAARARLFADKTKWEADENKRYALLDEHWDVITVTTSE